MPSYNFRATWTPNVDVGTWGYKLYRNAFPPESGWIPLKYIQGRTMNSYNFSAVTPEGTASIKFVLTGVAGQQPGDPESGYSNEAVVNLGGDPPPPPTIPGVPQWFGVTLQ